MRKPTLTTAALPLALLTAALRFSPGRRKGAGDHRPPGAASKQGDLLAAFRRGPMKDVEEIVLAVRQPGVDGRWYANFAYYADDENRLTCRDGGRLCRLNLLNGRLTTLLADERGAVRDPVVHYDAQKILFSYRKGGSPHYHLYEIGVLCDEGIFLRYPS